jgi:hypothetical protein
MRKGCIRCGESRLYQGVNWCSIVIQTGTVGGSPRRRAKGVTIVVCPDCLRWVTTKKGEPIRVAFAEAIKSQVAELQGARK